MIHEYRGEYEEAEKLCVDSLSILLRLHSPDAEIAIESLKRLRDTMGEEHFDTYWKTITNQDVPDFLISTYEDYIEDLVQHVLFLVDTSEHEEIEKVIETLKHLLKESNPDEKQFLQILLDYISRKDITQKIKDLKEPYKSILEKHIK